MDSALVASTPKNQRAKGQAVTSRNPGTHFSGKESSLDLGSCAVKVGEKRKRYEYGECCSTEIRCSKSEDVIVNLISNDGRIVHINRRVSSDGGVAGQSGKQLNEVDLWSKETLPNAVNRNAQLNRKQVVHVGADVGISQNPEVDKNSGFCDTSLEVAAQPKTSKSADPKFNNFDKLREEVNFVVGQTWALYDTTDGMPRQYAQIRKVSVPSFGLRITYLEPHPDGEKEVLWFEEDLPVSVGKFRFGKNQNTKDCSIFSHVICCDGSVMAGHFTVSPRKGETWALFKNWDINWSSESDSHRKHEYEFVEILSDYTDEAGVSVGYLHKAKGFASVFFRTGTGDADISQILPHNLYRFSHRVPSFKLTGIEGKNVAKDAYELDRAALPETIEDITVPSLLLAEPTAPKPKPEALCFPSNGKKVFQTGQIWSLYSYYDDMPRYYCRIQKITLTQAFEQEAEYKLHVSRLAFP